MENKKLIYLFGAIFSIMFALFYFFVFDTFIKEEQASKTLYFNQVGLYKNEENSTQVIAKLKEQEMDCHPVKKEDVTAVVCGVSEDAQAVKEQQATLTSLNISFIEKQVALDTLDAITLWENKEITKVLEMMKY